MVKSRKSKSASQSSVIDGLSKDEEISCHFQKKLSSLLNQEDPSVMVEVSEAIPTALKLTARNQLYL